MFVFNIIIIYGLYLLQHQSNAITLNIEDFGAISSFEEPVVDICNANSKAIEIAFSLAHSHQNLDRIVYIPNKRFYFAPIELIGIHHVIFHIAGELFAHSDILHWPMNDNGFAKHQIHFVNVSNILLTGGGTINGQGYYWWWWAISCALPHAKHNDTRGSMLYWEQSENITIDNLSFINSPRFHIFLNDVNNVTIQNFNIYVDVDKQKKLFNYVSNTLSDMDNKNIPSYPLNTDGIDPKGSNIHIINGTITNFDDAIAFKPCNQANIYCRNGCASGYVYNITTYYSVGMTIGSGIVYIYIVYYSSFQLYLLLHILVNTML
jgi:galacturan 1,4-alpha-galacturonidase